MEYSNQKISKLCFAFILLWLLILNSVLPVRAQETSLPVEFQNILLTSPWLDEDVSNWDVYTEGSPTWALSNVVAPSLDGNALRCALTGGSPYSNVHCYQNLPAKPNSSIFSLSMSFYYQPASSFNNIGEPSIVQGLEFTMNKWDHGSRYEWAIQWDNVDQGAPKWRYWAPSQSPQWVDLGISGAIAGEEWHTLKLEGKIVNKQVYYQRFIFDQQEYPLGITTAPVSAVGESDRLAIAVQLDGNYVETPYELIVDHVLLDTKPTFIDVPDNYWAFDWIERVYVAAITGGCASNPLQYCPENPVSRAQMAIFLERGINNLSPTPPPAIPPATGTVFGDVPVAYWAAAYIEQLAHDGITSGCGGGNYCPEDVVTRAQMAVFLLKAKYGTSYTPPAVGLSTSFSDVPTNYWAAGWIKQLAAEGITGGCGTNLYCPESPVTRAQMAVFLVRTFNLP